MARCRYKSFSSLEILFEIQNDISSKASIEKFDISETASGVLIRIFNSERELLLGNTSALKLRVPRRCVHLRHFQIQRESFGTQCTGCELNKTNGHQNKPLFSREYKCNFSTSIHVAKAAVLMAKCFCQTHFEESLKIADILQTATF